MADEDQSNTNTSLLGGAADTNAGSDGGSSDGGDAGAQGTDVAKATDTANDGTDAGGKATSEDANGGQGEDAPIEYNLRFPEGSQVDEDAASGLVELAKEHKLPPEVAQKIAAFGVPVLNKAQQQQQEAFNAQLKAWESEVLADADIGGVALQDNLRLAAKAIDRFGGDALRQVFDATGLGNHPQLVKAFVQIGKAISDDTLVGLNSSKATGDQGLAKQMFPYMN